MPFPLLHRRWTSEPGAPHPSHPQVPAHLLQSGTQSRPTPRFTRESCHGRHCPAVFPRSSEVPQVPLSGGSSRKILKVPVEVLSALPDMNIYCSQSQGLSYWHSQAPVALHLGLSPHSLGILQPRFIEGSREPAVSPSFTHMTLVDLRGPCEVMLTCTAPQNSLRQDLLCSARSPLFIVSNTVDTTWLIITCIVVVATE